MSEKINSAIEVSTETKERKRNPYYDMANELLNACLFITLIFFVFCMALAIIFLNE